MTDIVDQLRSHRGTAKPVSITMLERAATEIETLRAENKALGEANEERNTREGKLRAENRDLRFRVLHPNVAINDVTNEPTWREGPRARELREYDDTFE